MPCPKPRRPARTERNAGAGAGIIGGVLAASRDARVKNAGTQLLDNLLGSVDRSAAQFVDPLLDAIDQVQDRSQALEGILDRAMYQVIWQSQDGNINIDGDRHFFDMNRAMAVEACQSLKVLRVYCINLIEGTVRDVTAEVMAEAGMSEVAA